MKKQTLLRKLQHKALAEARIQGRVLDLGGSKNSDYFKIILEKTKNIIVVNVDESASPDKIVDLENPLPFHNGEFDCVVAMNLLEHIYNFKQLISESARVLKPGGELILSVPFLLYIHPSPRDYFRFSEDAFNKILKEAGFRDVVIKNLGYGMMTARYQVGQLAIPGCLRPICSKCAVVADSLLKCFARILNKKYNPQNFPLGYFVQAKK